MNKLLRNKKFLSVYLAWVLLNTFFLLQNTGNGWAADQFWPFSEHGLKAYDVSEWVVYVFAPLVILFLLFSFRDNIDAKVIVVIITTAITIWTSGRARGQNLNSLISDGVPAHFQSQDEPLIQHLPMPVEHKVTQQKHRQKITKAHEDPFADMKASLSVHTKDAQEQVSSSSTETRNDIQYLSVGPLTENSSYSSPDYQSPVPTISFTGDISRFKNSPCYNILGYDPNQSREEQEKRYEECEKEKSREESTHTGVIALVIISIVGVIYLGVRAKTT